MNYKKYIQDIPNFPKTGVTFKDISPLLLNENIRNHLIKDICSHISEWGVTHVAGLDARGFIFGSMIAQELDLPFLMIRKSGKLPGKTHKETYDLEYGSAELEIQADSLQKEDIVLIIDDVLATGGTMSAAIKLIESTHASIGGIVCAIELGFLNGKDTLPHIPYYSPIIYT